jgi:hypothetical protein
MTTMQSEMLIFTTEPSQQESYQDSMKRSRENRVQCLLQKSYFYCHNQKLTPSHSDDFSLKLQENKISTVQESEDEISKSLLVMMMGETAKHSNEIERKKLL